VLFCASAGSGESGFASAKATTVPEKKFPTIPTTTEATASFVNRRTIRHRITITIIPTTMGRSFTVFQEENTILRFACRPIITSLDFQIVAAYLWNRQEA
jgi:hypothetical protein